MWISLLTVSLCVCFKEELIKFTTCLTADKKVRCPALMFCTYVCFRPITSNSKSNFLERTRGRWCKWPPGCIDLTCDWPTRFENKEGRWTLWKEMILDLDERATRPTINRSTSCALGYIILIVCFSFTGCLSPPLSRSVRLPLSLSLSPLSPFIINDVRSSGRFPPPSTPSLSCLS